MIPRMETTTHLETLSDYSPELSRLDFVESFVGRAEAEGRLSSTGVTKIMKLFENVPAPVDSGLSEEQAECFVDFTAQLVEYCLRDTEIHKPGFVNPLVQAAIDLHFCEDCDPGTWQLDLIDDLARRGRSRKKTFGQVKMRPRDPDDPSFFGGSWVIQREDVQRRVVFAIHAHAEEEQTSVEPIPVDAPDHDRWRAMVAVRGDVPARLQVEAVSPLGAWIRGLTGTKDIGQHRGAIALGVLCEAVEREARSRGLVGLLLGPSRRDPPTEPWHTGSFLRPAHDLRATPDVRYFRWEGLALEEATGALVSARIDIKVEASVVTDTAL